jgi:DNA-binding HxlR family transcriptional regulator
MATRSAAEQRAEAKMAYDAFLAVCPSRQLLDRLSNKWVVLVLAALGSDGSAPPDGVCEVADRQLRYSELARQLAGVSQKMLTQTLRSLERDGLVTRTVVPTVPVTVTYELTDLGRSLYATVRDLKVWAQQHMDEVAAHRERYDRDTAGE